MAESIFGDVSVEVSQIQISGVAGQPGPAQAKPTSNHTCFDRVVPPQFDPAGWARLIRSYAVLGDSADQAAALARARAQFKDRPDALRLVNAAAAGPQ